MPTLFFKLADLIKNAWAILGALPIGDDRDDFERLGWASDYQREFLDPEHSCQSDNLD